MSFDDPCAEHPAPDAGGPASGPYRRTLLKRAVLPLAHTLLQARALGPRLGRYEPRSTLVRESHPVERARLRAIDVHTHLGRWLTPDGSWMEPDVGALLELMDECNVETLVNLDGRWGSELEANLDRYDRAFPGRFVTFCHVDWSLLQSPSGAGGLVASLERSVAAGARGLKVWKDLGLGVKVNGRLVLPDDPRLVPLWETAAGLGVPVLVHTADPVAFFDPVDRHNERIEELLRHPSRSLASVGRGGFERLIDAFEALVASNPATRFVGAHVGCYPENLAWVSRMLDRYANLWIDTSARASDLGRQPRASARLFERHADRILFGTDSFPIRKAEYCAYFRLLESSDEHYSYSNLPTPPNGRWTISGLALDDTVLEQVYAANAARLLDRVAV